MNWKCGSRSPKGEEADTRVLVQVGELTRGGAKGAVEVEGSVRTPFLGEEDAGDIGLAVMLGGDGQGVVRGEQLCEGVVGGAVHLFERTCLPENYVGEQHPLAHPPYVW